MSVKQYSMAPGIWKTLPNGGNCNDDIYYCQCLWVYMNCTTQLACLYFCRDYHHYLLPPLTSKICIHVLFSSWGGWGSSREAIPLHFDPFSMRCHHWSMLSHSLNFKKRSWVPIPQISRHESSVCPRVWIVLRIIYLTNRVITNPHITLILIFPKS